MKNKTKAPTGAKCTSTASGGMLKCVATGDHAVHSNRVPGRKGAQYSTWCVGQNGRVTVVSFSTSGKQQGKWEEDAPAADPVETIAERDARIDREIAEEFEAAVAHEMEHPSGAEARFKAGGAVVGNELVVAREAARRKKAAKATKAEVAKVFAEPKNPDPTFPKATKPARQKHDNSEPAPTFAVGDYVRMVGRANGETGVVLELVDTKRGPRARIRWRDSEQFVDLGELAKSDLVGAAVSFTDLCLKCGLAKHAGKCASSKKPATTTQAEAVPAPHEALKILGYRRHPVAAVYPMMEGQAFEEFADLVQAHGLQDAIELVEVDGEQWILDGSNRALACERRNVTPRFELYKGKTDLESLKLYSALKNGAGRRHLDPSIRAMIASDLAELGQGDRADRQTGQSTGLTQAEAGKKFGVSEKSVRRARVVKTKGTPKVNAAVMKGKLSVEAAEQVTKLSPKEQDAIADEALAKAEGRAVRSGRVRSLVKQQEKRDTVRKINEGRVLPPPLGPFGVIYGDYPWKYENSDQHEGSRGHMGYPPMDFDEIIAHAREMRSRAAKDCVIALWVTNLYIPKIGAVIEAYGAEHRTMLTWPKPRAGVGTWPRGQTEHLVIASIGEPVHTLNEISTLLESFQPQHPSEHSSKPAEVAALLLKHCSGPHLELFGRDPRENWIVWGAESQKFASEAA